jgi:hemoglobin
MWRVRWPSTTAGLDLADISYTSLLRDSLLQPLFGIGQPHHVPHFAVFEAESFGGPDTFSREMGGFAGLIAAHRGLKITEEQWQRFVDLYLVAADIAGPPNDAPFREALRTHVEFGSQVAKQNSHAETGDELYPLREVPRWQWAQTSAEEQPLNAHG